MTSERRGERVRRVAEDIRRYTQDLLAQNERLRLEQAPLEAARQRLGADLTLAQAECAALRARLAAAEEQLAHARAEGQATRAAPHGRERDGLLLERELARIAGENRRIGDRLATLEQQNNELATLYVASRRLHDAVDRRALIAVIEEILADLVGSEAVAILEVPPGSRCLHLVACRGVEPEAFASLEIGQGCIGRAVADGEVYVRESDGCGSHAELSACIPLRLGSRVTGAIAVFGLLPQKIGIEALDREVFSLLATQAAAVLYCSASAGPDERE